MQLLTQELWGKLLANGRQQQPLRGSCDEIDFVPVVRLFSLDVGAAWLPTEIDPDDPTSSSAFATSESAAPNLAAQASASLARCAETLGLSVDHFRAHQTLSAYADHAQRHGAIRA